MALSARDSFSYVVTPNVDHVLLLNPKRADDSTARFRDAYSAAAMRLCDSRILQKLARFRGVRLDVVPGSDLTAHLFASGAFKGRKIAIVGGDGTMVADLVDRFPGSTLVQHRPPMGVLQNAAAIEDIVAFVAHERADFILFAIGAPQSEIVALACRQAGTCRGVGLCIGASIEFIIGRKRRAPAWMQRLSLEWAYRLLSEPRRLWRRYLLTGPRIFLLAVRGG
ncbi:MAG: WecB/TagA/CpsF family glycosyltransferase [Sphingomonadales bacterium]|nr:WecB/TagA/CpsF family glycosyltransferase [Sphingomonadales bacterium]